MITSTSMTDKKDGVYQEWHKNGTKALETTYADGEINGQYIEWHANGTQKVETTYSVGKINGKYQQWYPNGNKHIETICVDRKISGLYQEWHSNGELHIETTYVDDKKHGLYTGWYLNKNKFVDVTYIDGKKTGIYREWHEDGTERVVCEYKKDEVLRLIKLVDPKGRNCILPEGDIIVWKACVTEDERNVFVELMVPAAARRVTPVDKNSTYKARVEYGTVLSITDLKGNQFDSAESNIYHKKILKYYVGQEVRPDGFDPNMNNTCGQGINVHRHREHCLHWFK